MPNGVFILHDSTMLHRPQQQQQQQRRRRRRWLALASVSMVIFVLLTTSVVRFFKQSMQLLHLLKDNYNQQRNFIAVVGKNMLPKVSTPTITIQEASDKSSVDYFACCGLGHRMSKMCDANVVAKLRNWALRIYWGTCPRFNNSNVELFEYFFGPQPLQELVTVNSTGKVIRFGNEVTGFTLFARRGESEACRCSPHITEIHNQFFTSLRDERFRFRQEVIDFVHQHFDTYTVMGIHIRTGNGEKGDFTTKNRQIEDMTSWIHNVSQELIRLRQTFPKPARLFVATDTHSIMPLLQKELENSTMDILEYQQHRLTEGSGVFFGENYGGKDITHRDNQHVTWAP